MSTSALRLNRNHEPFHHWWQPAVFGNVAKRNAYDVPMPMSAPSSPGS